MTDGILFWWRKLVIIFLMIIKQEKEIKKIVNQIVENYKPEKVILFGSFAYGKPKENSDVDLMVIKKTNNRFIRRLFRVVEGIDSDLGTDILVYTPKEWARRLKEGHYFFKEVAQRGRILYEKKSK